MFGLEPLVGNIPGSNESRLRQCSQQLDEERRNQGTEALFYTNAAIPSNLLSQAVARWVVPALQATVRSLKEARESRGTVIKKFAHRVFEEFDADRALWLRAIRVLSELDCLFSLAKSSTAIGEPACRPEFVEGEGALVDFKGLRHPALDMKNGDFIPNDVKLGGAVGRVVLLTGTF